MARNRRNISFTLPEKDGYAVVLSNVPKGYPPSVVDRYGVICLIEIGGLTGLQPFTSNDASYYYDPANVDLEYIIQQRGV